MRKLLFYITIFTSLNLNAQNHLIQFTGSGASTEVTTIKVENLMAGTFLTLNGGDILHLSGSVGISINSDVNPSKMRIFPNPMIGNSTIEIYPPEEGDAIVTIYEITGKPIFQVHSFLENTKQEFNLSGLTRGLYLISIAGNTYQFSGKLLCTELDGGLVKLDKVNSSSKTSNLKITKKEYNETQGIVDMPYTSGDRLKFTAISGNYSTVKTDIPTTDKTLSFNFIDCQDGDNNNYPVVEIGNQTWMASNLKTTKLNDGSSIPSVSDASGWSSLTSPGYCWYNNDVTLKSTYGALYNWYALNSGKLCPSGWHIPSDAEWIKLANALDGENEAGGRLKETGNLHWSSPNIGATNEKGFTSIPGGYRKFDGTYSNLGSVGLWWSTSETDTTEMRKRLIGFDNSSLEWSNSLQKEGLSVRCLNGPIPKVTIPILSNTSVTGITTNSANIDCIVLSDGNSMVHERGIYWGIAQNPLTTGTKLQIGNGSGSFSASLSGLTPNTVYYVIPFATNNAGTSYGDLISFTANYQSAGQILSGAIESMTDLVFEISLGHEIGNCWAQHIAKVQYTQEDRYVPVMSKINNNWLNFYTKTGKDIALLLEMASSNNHKSYKGVALILQAYITSVFTDLFGPIPYSEAWGDNMSPRYDDQEFIYRKLISNLEAANLLLGTGNEQLDGDNLYHGDTFAWKKFANSLRMRLILRMSAQDPNFAKTELTKMTGDITTYPIFESNDDNASFAYQEAAPHNNPIQENQKYRDDYRVSESVVDLMWNNSPNLDYRLVLYAQNLGAGLGYFVGLPNGLTNEKAAAYNGNGFKNTSKLGSYFSAATAPGILMNYSEVLFIKSEAALKGYTPGSDTEAERNYEAAIKASYYQFGDALVLLCANIFANADWNIDSLANDFYNNDSWRWEASYTNAEKMQLIGTQKWAAMFDQGLQSWFEWRRTGCPVLRPAEDGLNYDKIPVRVVYPLDEQLKNSTNLQEGINMLGGGNNDLNTNVWWDSETPIVLPSVTTTAANLITSNSALSGGFVRTSPSPVTARGVCWNKIGSPTISDNFTLDGSGTGAFSSLISGLESNQNYVIRAYATTSSGTIYGISSSFSTFPLTPTLTSNEITNFTRTTAICGGTVINIGGSMVTAYGVCWSTQNAPTVLDSLTIDGTGSGTFISTITGLLPNTTYKVRSYATNSFGTGYGPQQVFKTNPAGIIAFNPDLTYGSVSDVDGNTYKTIVIGTQEWMAENLKTTKYSNNDIIPTTSPATLDISGEATPKYQWALNGDNKNVEIYGRQYTWYAANDIRNVCPAGWHMPTDAEWTILNDYLGGSSVAGRKLKETGTSNWIYSNSGGSNQSGFTALPGSDRYMNEFGTPGYYGFWWTSTQTSDESGSYYFMAYNSDKTDLSGDYKNSGHSVRCLAGSETSIISYIKPSELIEYKILRTPSISINLDIPKGAPVATIRVSYYFMRVSDSTTSNTLTFDIPVNGENAIGAVVKSIPFTWESLRNGIVLPTDPQIPVLETEPNLLEFTDSYWDFSYVIIFPDGSELKNNEKTNVSIVQNFAGTYDVELYYFHPTAGGSYPTEPYGGIRRLTKYLTSVSAFDCTTDFGVWTANLTNINIDSNNKITISFNRADAVSGDPKNASNINSYDPETGIIQIYYYYPGAGGNRIFWERFTPR